MNTLCKEDEARILAVLKKYYQVSHNDLKIYMEYKGNPGVFKRTLQKLVNEGHVKSISGLGTIYWRYNIPITTISRKQYISALKLIEAYTLQLEKNQIQEESIDHKIHKSTEILDNFDYTGDIIGDLTITDYTNNERLLNKIIIYYIEYHNISKVDFMELMVSELPEISKEKFKKLNGVGEKTVDLLEQLCDLSGIKLIP